MMKRSDENAVTGKSLNDLAKYDLKVANTENADDQDDDEDLSKQLAEKKLHRSNSIPQNSANSYVEPNSSFSLWNMIFGNNQDAIEKIEQQLFVNFNLLPSFSRRYVHICNKSLRIWTVSLNTESKNTPVVLIHGFGGGSALWLQNFKHLSKSRPLYAIDLLGFARSSRSSFSSDPIVSEMQFIESIENWRKELDIKEMVLLGHSFGGYLICSYSIKYPDRTKALILVDPWGFLEQVPSINKLDTPTPIWVKVLTNISRYINPMSLLRTSGPIAVPLFKLLKPDFKTKYFDVLGANSDLIYDYLYNCNKLYPTGEDGYRSMSEEHGFAKNPMIRRIDKIHPTVPVFFIYGSRSWIDSSPGFASKAIRNRYGYVSVRIIPGAGHHVYADKAQLFNDYVHEILEIIDAHQNEMDNYEENEATTSTNISDH